MLRFCWAAFQADLLWDICSLNSFQQACCVLPGIPTVSPETQSSTPQDLQTLFKPFWEAWQIIHTDYVDQPVDNTKLMEGAITGMVQSLGDPHSEYMDPQVL